MNSKTPKTSKTPEAKLKRFKVPFSKTTYGYFVVLAADKKEALDLAEAADMDSIIFEEDVESEYIVCGGVRNAEKDKLDLVEDY